MIKIVRFLFLTALMAPAIVLSMGLEEYRNREPREKIEPGALYLALTDHLSPDTSRLVMGFIPLEDTIPNRLLSCEKLVKSKITQEQYKLLHLLAKQDKYAHKDAFSMGRFAYRLTVIANYNASWGDGMSFMFMHDRPLWLRMHYANIRAIINKEHRKPENKNDLHTAFYTLYPLDLSILARKHNIPVKELRKALDSFDPEIKAHIIKTYNIKTDWFYWSTRPALLYSAAGIAVAGLGVYLGWKLFKRS